MFLSVVIPTLNEANNIHKLLIFLIEHLPKNQSEIIISDGGSSDNTREIAQKYGAIVVQSPKKGRAAQMNFGVEKSKGDILQFIHADTIPPVSFYTDIQNALNENYSAGCFTYCFDSSSFLLKINAYFTRFNFLWCRGGDQAIFIQRSVFNKLGRYREDYMIMEEYDLLKKIQTTYSFKIIKNNATVSARKYQKNGYFRVQVANLLVFNMYRLGYSQKKLVNMYRTILN